MVSPYTEQDQRIRYQRADNSEAGRPDDKGKQVGLKLLTENGKVEMVPDCRSLNQYDKVLKDRIQCARVADRHEIEPHPHGTSENRQDGPGVVDQGTG